MSAKKNPLLLRMIETARTRGVKGRQSSPDKKSGGWEVVYTGFVLILLCFFIMLTSFASIEEGRLGRFVKSFVNAVNVFSGGVKFTSGKEVLRGSADIVDKTSEIAEISLRLRNTIKNYKYGAGVDASCNEEGVTVRFPDTVLFGLGAADILPEVLPLLESIGNIIAEMDRSVRIEGHTDNLPIHTSKYPSNWELSTTRAVNVLRHLINNERIDPKKLSAAGFGEFQPLVPNDNPRNRTINRRVEIVFIEEECDSSGVE